MGRGQEGVVGRPRDAGCAGAGHRGSAAARLAAGRPAARPAARARKMAGAVTTAPKKNGPSMFTEAKKKLAACGPMTLDKALMALLSPMIWPWLCSSMARDINAPALGKATEEATALRAITAEVDQPPSPNGCTA